MKTIYFLFGVGFAVALYGLAGSYDYSEELDQRAYYCEMVKLYEDTNGESGWPDFDGGSCE